MITRLVFLFDFAYFEKHYRLIAADVSKEKALYADSRAIQQVILLLRQQSKETILQFSKGTT